MIKLTLDETIQEQNSLLDGSAIHNRLKYLGILDKPSSSSNTFNIDKAYYSKDLDYDSKYKLLDDARYKYLEYDGNSKIKPHKKSTNLIMNDVYLSNPYNNYNSNYKPRAYDLSSTIYDDHHNDSYNLPIHFQNYGKTMNFHSPYPREQVYYFPTSKPLAQYPRQITERFYRQKPVKQYPEEELSFWHTRHPKPVRIIEREPFYAAVDYNYRNNYNVGNKNIEPYYTPEYRAKYFPTNYNIYNDYNDSNYYYEPDLEQRSFSSITRPCSPIHTRNNLYDTNYFKNHGSLLEKKIRDYVWKPHEEHVEKYSFPNYNKNTYYKNFEPLKNRCQDNEIFRKNSSLGLDFQRRHKKTEIVNNETKENPYKDNLITKSPERKLSKNKNDQTRKDDDSFYKSNEKKPDNSVHFLKQISFDLGNEDPSNYIKENTNKNVVPNERKLSLGRRESNTKLNDKRRISLLSNDSNTSNNKQHDTQSSINDHFRKESVSKQEKLISNGNSFQSDKYLYSRNNSQENDLNLIKNSTPNYNNVNNGIVNSNDNNVMQNISNGNIHREIRRDSNSIGRRKLSETTNKLNYDYPNHSENISNKKDNLQFIKRNDSCDDEQKYTNENISSNIKTLNNVDNQLSKECVNYQSNLNESPMNVINNPSVVYHNDDIHNLNKFNTNDQKIDRPEQYINDNVENRNDSETIQNYQVDNPKEETNKYSTEQDSTDFTINPNDQQPSRENLTEEYNIDDKNYFQNHDDENLNDNLTHEHEIPEYLDGQNDNYDNNYYTDNHQVNVTEEIPTRDQDNEHIQSDEFIDENRMQNEYYYQNPTDGRKENVTENQYDNPEPRENADDYYFQNYSNDASKEQLENQYDESNNQREYANEHINNSDSNYYYQDHEKPLHPDTLEQNEDQQQYVDPNYQHVDDYYQNYSDVDPNAQQENKYIESSHQGEYIAENNIEHDDYYYQNHPTTTNENQIDQNYIESEHDGGNYIDGVQDNNNYYYENNSNLNQNTLPTAQLYDGSVNQENYAEDQNHVNNDYYYQKHDENNYDGSMPKEHYDGYVDDQQAPNNSYYPQSDTNDYEQKYNINYENDNNYQTQQSEYNMEPVYEQNPNNENYNYSDNVVDENRATDELPINIQNDCKDNEN